MILFGIPNCDTVKKARAYLEQAGLSYRFHDFRKDGLTPQLIQTWMLKVSYNELINKRSTTWKQLDDPQRQAIEQQDLALLGQHPTLIKRPVLQTADTILVGFKPTEYDSLR
jgi:Spx/MgsR family transcriptional regulator